MSAEVFTIGEALLRLSVGAGERLEQSPAFDVHVAGAEANVAVALARLGRRAAWWSKVPDGPLGRRVVGALRAAGVDVSDVASEPGARLGTYYVEMHAPPRPVSVVYDRANSAAASITPADLPLELAAGADWILVSGITPALSDGCREATAALTDLARSGAPFLAVDVNYRAKLWSPSEARSCMAGIAEGADLLVCTREDARDVFGLDGAPGELASSLAEATGASQVVITLGEEGAVGIDSAGLHRVDAIPTGIVDRLGAGDAFTAGVLDGLLDGSLVSGLERGVALATMVLGTRGDHFVGSRSEMEAVLTSGGRSVDR
jgi:2-dehydro-3-deoxygluconokinase